jgi:hypothetical protein
VALASQQQQDFSAGIYRGRKAPENAVYDCVNGLINDEGLIYRRGGTTYRSEEDADETLLRLHAIFMRAPGEPRVLASSDVALYVLNDSDEPVVIGQPTRSRPASVGDFAVFAVSAYLIQLYGGNQLEVSYSTGTVDVTEGSAAVTGAGTAFASNLDSGSILRVAGDFAVVRSVDSDTELTLASPWTGATAVGTAYDLNATFSFGITALAGETGRPYLASAGAGTSRLLLCVGNRIYFTPPGDPIGFAADQYHEVPANVTIVGAEGMGDSVLIFTTRGVWRISNLSLDPVDAYGNIQHTVEQVNTDVTLWDDYGIAGYGTGIVVPAIDDVFLMGGDGLAPLTGRIRPLYRGHVRAGYQPGMASVHRGHYFLPIMDGTTLVDTLVCRLDRDAAWTRFAGGAAGPAYATLIEETAREPKLLGLKGERVTDLTRCFATTTATDADGTTSDLVIETRDFPLGANQPGFAQKVRARYELDGAATVTPAFSSDQDAGVFTELTGLGEQDGGDGWAESDGSKYQWAIVGKKRERIRFRLTIAGACTSFVMRSIELLTRPSGKQ